MPLQLEKISPAKKQKKGVPQEKGIAWRDPAKPGNFAVYPTPLTRDSCSCFHLDNLRSNDYRRREFI
jgi:hypothetical protein